MNWAKLNESGVVIDVMVNDSQPEGTVACPDHIGIGMPINAVIIASIDDARALKLDQITKDRDTACFADVVVLGHPWQADIRSQQMLASAILLAQAGVYTPTVWRDANNVDVPVTLPQLVGIAGTMAAQTQAAYATSWARKAALEAATTVEDVEAV